MDFPSFRIAYKNVSAGFASPCKNVLFYFSSCPCYYIFYSYSVKSLNYSNFTFFLFQISHHYHNCVNWKCNFLNKEKSTNIYKKPIAPEDFAH